VISALLDANAQAFNDAILERQANADLDHSHPHPQPQLLNTTRTNPNTATARSSSRVTDSTSWPPPPKNPPTTSASIQEVVPTQQEAIEDYHHHQKINHSPTTTRPSTAPPSTSTDLHPIPFSLLTSTTAVSNQRLGPFLDDSFLATSTNGSISTPPLSEGGTPGSIEHASPFSVTTPLNFDGSSDPMEVEVPVGGVTGDGLLGFSPDGNSPTTSTDSDASSPTPRLVTIMPTAIKSTSGQTLREPPDVGGNSTLKTRSSSLGITSNFSLTLPSALENRGGTSKIENGLINTPSRSNSPKVEDGQTSHQPPWRVRAILRSHKDSEVDGDVAFQLRARGVELSYVDFEELEGLDENSEEEDKQQGLVKSGLTAALDGAWGVLVSEELNIKDGQRVREGEEEVGRAEDGR